MTHAEAGRRGGLANGRRNKAKTHCPHGHPYAGENLYVNPIRGWRACLACRRLHRRAYWRETGK